MRDAEAVGKVCPRRQGCRVIDGDARAGRVAVVGSGGEITGHVRPGVEHIQEDGVLHGVTDLRVIEDRCQGGDVRIGHGIGKDWIGPEVETAVQVVVDLDVARPQLSVGVVG